MQRYSLDFGGCMVQHRLGDYVEYIDVAEELERLRAERLLLAKVAQNAATSDERYQAHLLSHRIIAKESNVPAQ